MTEISAAPAGQWYPLSSGQLEMWLINQSGSARAAYSVPLLHELEGTLDVASLRRAFEDLIHENEALRTTFADIDGTPMQRPIDDMALDWQMVAGVSDTRQLIDEFIALDFDLAAGHLFRVLLIECSAIEHQLVIVAHQIAVDSRSLSLLIDRVARSYEAYTTGRPAQAEVPAPQYKDYAYWQHLQLGQGSLEPARLYWNEQLDGEPERLDLLTDRVRPAASTGAGAVIIRTIEASVLEAFSALCRQESTTLFAGLCAVLRTELYRYTGRRDFVLGTTVLTRSAPDLHDKIGYYVNTLALRDVVQPGSSMRDVIRVAGSTVQDGMRHHEYPFDRVARECRLRWQAGNSPLFEVMLALEEDWGGLAKSMGDIKIRRLEVSNGHSKADLTLFFRALDTGLRISAEYSTEIFNAVRIERLLLHYETLLCAAVASPDTPVDALQMITSSERRQVLVDFNRTQTTYQLNTPVPQLFERQAKRTPHATAVVDGERSLTFAQLNTLTNRLAWTLRDDYGVKPGSLIALQMHRSIELTAAVIGTLKAGGAFLPINVEDPVDRVATFLGDSASCALLVRGWPDGSECAHGVPVLDVSRTDQLSPREDDPPALAGPDDLAYCIYTSGSTGLPKGALIEHRGLVNRLLWMIDDLGLDQSDTILQKTPSVFDVSVWELLLPAILGARQVILRADGELEPVAIRDAIERYGVTTLHFVPSMLNQYLAVVPDGFRGVRNCISSGEALDLDLANRFFEATHNSDTRLYNYYGPTEATVDVTSLRVSSGQGRVTLGRPAANTRIYVLDAGGQPCPVDVAGELCIAGVQTGRGYLNRPELTAQKFCDDPFRPGERMYRTGDLVHWSRDGELVFLGRRDEQLKVRGLRIEPAEIEQALRTQPGVRRAVVLLLDGEHLCAYLEGDECPPAEQIRDNLSNLLPRHMIPSCYVVVGSIPVTRNGKVDRKALVKLGGAQVAATQHVLPRNQLERDLVVIWRSLLPASRIGVTDDFFLLGGHSLNALRMVARIADRFGIQLTVASILEHRTIAELARLIADSDVSSTQGMPQWTPRPDAITHVLSFAQERMWFLHMLNPDSAAYNIRALARLDGRLDTELFRRAVQDLVLRHEMLRVTFANDGVTALQTPRFDLPLPFEVRDLTGMPLENARHTVRDYVHRDDAVPFQLHIEAPVRVALFCLTETEHVLLVTLHHIAGDGWSMRLLMRDLSALYEQNVNQSTTKLAPLATQYIDYARAIRAPEYQEAVEAHLSYWVSRLAGCPPLDLPTDITTSSGDRRAGARAAVLVSTETMQNLRKLAGSSGSTPFEIVMSALSLLLSRLADQQDVVIGFPVANRETVELEEIVGLFLNTLVLRTDLSREPNFTELLSRVSSSVREAYDHQTAPFELVVERINPERRLDRTPIFDVLLNYQTDLQEEMSIEGVCVEFDESLFEHEAKLPLTFYVREQGESASIELVYRPDLFSTTRAQAMLGQFCWLLDQVAQNPDRKLAAYSLASPGAAHADLGQPLERPELPPVTELIAAVTAQNPGRVAISQGLTTITYQDLVERSETLARQLTKQGCGRDDIVGVTGERGIDFVVGMLGVLRCGATMFPIDPALPGGRKRHLVHIGRPKLVVQTDSRPDPFAPGVAVIHIDSQAVTDVSLAPVSPDAPAYLFFTTGTTGAPRGVLGWHGALSHFLLWQRQTFGISPRDRCAQLTSASFDVMLRDTFVALVSGGTVVIPEPRDLLGGAAVLGWLQRERITVLHAVPTVLQTWLLDAPAETRLSDLKWIFLAGEPLKSALVEQLRAVCPDNTGIVNLYGPTETTLAKFAYEVPRGPLAAVLPVGSPLPQCHAAILRDDVVCGVGEPGEITIRTPFRSLGYLGAAQATAESFVPNPYRDDVEDLLYRTGDIGRLRPDGLFEILGRCDDQVKINGVRVHPAEVENALARHHLVDAGVVLAHKDATGAPHLVAYVVAKLESRDDPALIEKLRTFLAELLPRAMVPAEFIVLEQIPTNPNGKPDRGALPGPLFTRVAATLAADEHPGNDIEEKISRIWQTVLDRDCVGVRQDFFALGGTSLKLLRLYAQLEELFPGTFRVAQLFSCPTVASQARLVFPALPANDEVFEHEF